MANFRSRPVIFHVRDRKELDASLHSSIDTFLKSLKPACRRLQVASTTLANEEQLLQRLYYKGKNQHRSALFWRRTTELRRYSERIRSLNLSDTFTRLRCSFFGKNALSNQNLLKGSWNHFPNAQSLKRSLDYTAQAQALLTKFQARAVDAYSSFSTSMQTGAFIQILLVLAAISARMNSIAQEYLDILTLLQRSIHQLHTATTTTIANDLRPSCDAPTHLQKKADVAGSSLKHEEMITQIERETLLAQDVTEDASILANGETSGSPPGMAISGRTDSRMSSAATEKHANTTQLNTKLERRVGGEKSGRVKAQKSKRPPKEKKRKRDEIDDIFGF